MYQVVTRTGRTIQTGIAGLNDAINKLKLLEFEAKRTNTYNPGYYQIQKYDESTKINIAD